LTRRTWVQAAQLRVTRSRHTSWSWFCANCCAGMCHPTSAMITTFWTARGV